MEMFSEQEVKEHLHRLFWDYKVSKEEAWDLFTGKEQSAGGITRTNLLRKLVNGYRWHTVLKIVPKEQLKELLTDEIINGLFPRSLKAKYYHARKLL